MTAPIFVANDPVILLQEMIDAYEKATGKTLYPAQVERLLIDLILYREVLLRQAIQVAAEQNLVDYATGARLEGLGRLLGVKSRLPASQAKIRWRIHLPQATTTDTVLPAGFGAVAPDGVLWRLTQELIIPVGQQEAEALATCDIPGIKGNLTPKGTLFSPLIGQSNITALQDAAGGADAETDEQLRARIFEAPYGFSSAGPARAYRYHAMGVNPSIIDVAITTLAPGEVGVYPLVREGGVPSAALLTAVTEALNQDAIRPLCDKVSVLPAVRVEATISARLTVYEDANRANVLSAAQIKINSYLASHKGHLGKSLIASQIIALLSVEGVYKVELQNWADVILKPQEFADATATLALTLDAAKR